jgi:hypothetical protein
MVFGASVQLITVPSVFGAGKNFSIFIMKKISNGLVLVCMIAALAACSKSDEGHDKAAAEHASKAAEHAKVAETEAAAVEETAVDAAHETGDMASDAYDKAKEKVDDDDGGSGR